MNAPHDDGVFLVNMATGKSHQICFYDSLAAVSGFDEEQKVLVTQHLTDS